MCLTVDLSVVYVVVVSYLQLTCLVLCRCVLRLTYLLCIFSLQVKVWFQNRRTKYKRMKAEEGDGHPDCGRTISVDTMSEDEEDPEHEEEEDEDNHSEDDGSTEMQTEEQQQQQEQQQPQQQPKMVNSPQKPHNLHHLNRWRVETNQFA